ncbi:hypothetical protein H5410_054502 [Solanum commersonii]|uniref:Uncharacterized protein n=1 Tax=Solanum commersonii TaxID=4109 RepID=A0A9J5WHC7_SOLCO|nr:hypothetical protein H5410_054502 [Solanum commersonii]
MSLPMPRDKISLSGLLEIEGAFRVSYFLFNVGMTLVNGHVCKHRTGLPFKLRIFVEAVIIGSSRAESVW